VRAAATLRRVDGGACRELADAHADSLERAVRKQRGAWFTPMALALPTALRTLAPLLRARGGDPLRIVDPAVGGGAFLRAALQVLVAHGRSAGDALRCLFGLDVDGDAAALAARALHAEAHGAAAAPLPPDAAQVRGGDGLLELEAGTFDAVLTNPPWETLQGGAHTVARGEQLRTRFAHQGAGKLFTYRLFVERAFQLLRPGGRMGVVVPASLWFDRDARALRALLLERCEWEWLYGFENREQVFAIDSRYRFGVVVATKGGATHAVRVAFGRTAVADWAAAQPVHVRCTRDELEALSPASGAFVEVEHERDVAVLRRVVANGTPLLGPDAPFAWRQGDFNMTADRDAFVERERAEADGWRAEPEGVWRRAGAPDLLPLFQGAMVHALDPSGGAHAAGRGNRSTWRAAAPGELRPAFLVDAAAWRERARQRATPRVVHRALSNATNARTMLSALLADLPCGNSLGVLTARTGSERPALELAAVAAVLSSLPFDWALRARLAGTNLNRFVLADCVVPRLDGAVRTELAALALRLCATTAWQAPLCERAAAEGWGGDLRPATDAAERCQLATRIDVLVGRAFGLDTNDVAWLVRGCGDGAAERAQRTAKGFWRVDRELPAARRRPLRWLAAVTG
jgi:hypothetical protein